MSLECNTVIKIIKKAAVDAVMASQPMSVCTGEVEAVNPLRIRIDQKLVLPEKLLVLTNAVRDYNVKMTYKLEEVTIDREYQVNMGLQAGEKVILIKCDGGQRYIVLDRVEAIEYGDSNGVTEE